MVIDLFEIAGYGKALEELVRILRMLPDNHHLNAVKPYCVQVVKLERKDASGNPAPQPTFGNQL